MTRLALLAAALVAAGGAAAETRVTGADLAEIRATIHRQIDAFQACARRSGGPGASTTPAAVSFLELTVMGTEDVVQQVQVTDRAGAIWLAYYAMQRQKDGRWRASGCHLVPSARTVSAAYQPQ
ncbi:MAG: hypothetical protein QOD26_3958 [Betaproteobacteria bacterium]|nr:hypothetical protein [Betaproteobacteria bacterium]